MNNGGRALNGEPLALLSKWLATVNLAAAREFVYPHALPVSARSKVSVCHSPNA